jgi:hypothetical protein
MSDWQQQLTLAPAVLFAWEELAIFPCHDCQRNTVDEHYMVHGEVWRDAGMGYAAGYLCIGCLEARLRRELGPVDFSWLPVNHPAQNIYGRSERLWQRLGG